MSLETYKRKRDFRKTPEPAGHEGASAPTGHRRFVVQRHRATRLHYDFRLEIDGVLMSWAVPKGPPMGPLERRMAAHTEDHPLDYFDFEGVIPKGEYGGGDVIVWDWGTFQAEETDDPGAAVRKGELKFSLEGEKLRGRYVLVKVRSDDPEKDDWLLIHKKDEFALPGWNAEEHPHSVKTGRTNDEVAAGAEAVWDSRAPAAEAAIDLSAAARAPLPDFVPPMRATAVGEPFSDADWVFELKLDGYRIQAVVAAGKVRLWTRNRQDAARYFPDLAEARPSWIRAESAVVDGEVVALNQRGEPEFSLLQDRTGIRGAEARPPVRRNGGVREPRPPAPLVYYAFDLLHLDGRSLLEVPLEQRKKLLRSVLRDHPIVRYGSHIEEEGEAFYEACRERGLEGIVAKLRRSRYEPGRRSRSWLKLKIRREQELVVGGYEPGKGSHTDLGSLIVGVYEDGQLRYAGEVGSGLDERTRRWFLQQLDGHRVESPPFVDAPRIKGARWSEPRIVIRAEFAEWTADDLLRQSAFKGLEIDRDPKSVVRERTIRTATATRAAENSAAPERTDPAGVGTNPDGRTPTRSRRRTSTSGAPATVATRGPGAIKLTEDARARSDPPQAATDEELAALEELRAEGNWAVGGHTVHLTNLDKVLFPDAGYTKRDLIRYYVSIAPVMLPYLRDRPLNLHRWPEGITARNHFWQKQVPSHAPAWMARWDNTEADASESRTYIVADRVATMAWLANHAAIDLHAWTSRAADPHRPTYALIDVDPGDRTTFEEILLLARLYRAALEHLGVTGVPKLTGKRGIQVWIPIKPVYSYDQTRVWVETLSRAVGATVPDLVSWEWEKSERRGRARLDYTQNAINKTLVAPYAVRPAPGAPVSAPIRWEELDDPELRPNRWNIRTLVPRVEELGDLFRPVLELEQALPSL